MLTCPVKISPEERLVMESFAANLVRLRKQSGQTQEQLAEAVGFTSRFIRKLEAGEVDVGLRTLTKFAGHFGVHMTSLLRPAKLAPPNPGRPIGSRSKKTSRVRPAR